MGAGASSNVPPRYKWNQDHTLRGPWTFLFKEKVQCACEGSMWCTRENPAKQKQTNAISGLHSSWVGDNVLAMARPWQSAVVAQGLVAAFQRANIGMILNLQEVGEHASCGPGNLPASGFTYDPETFMAAGVGYYNFAWRDMGVPSLDRMMDIVQVMDYVTRVERRKIAVHCHAGLGRTGLAIACFFVFAGLYDGPEAAIAAVRRNRPGAVQTSKQAAFVTIFAQYLQHLRCLYHHHPLSSNHHQARTHHHSGSTANLADAAAAGGGGGGRGGGDQGPLLETRSAPAAGLPKDGLLESKATPTGLLGVYESGLTVTVPLLQAPSAGNVPSALAAASAGAATGAAADTLTEADLGLQRGKQLPWSDAFHIQPQLLAADFRPAPPRSYTEALARQARLLHGPERRAFLKLHKLVKEAVFGILAAAQAFQPSSRGAAARCGGGGGALALPAILEDDLAAAAAAAAAAAPPPPLQRCKSSTAAAAAAAAAAASAGGSPHAPPLPPTFAHLLAYLIASHGSNHVDTAALAPLMAHKAYAAAVGPQVESRAVLDAASALRGKVNLGQWGGLARAPLLLQVMLLEGFFANFRTGDEPASLTPDCLRVISKSYQDLFNGQRPAPPSRSGSREPSTAGAAAASTDAAVNGSAGSAAAAEDAGGAAVSTSLEYARQAYDLLEPLEQRDFELLLVFAALLRVVARGSGPGSEDSVVELGKWATALLLGRLSELPEAEEAVLSFLWYLAGRDEAYAMLVLLKRQRLAGLARRSGQPAATAADVASMLQAAAVALAAPPLPAAAAPASPALAPSPDGAATASALGSFTSTIVAPMRDGDRASVDGAAAAAASPLSPRALPAQQMAQLLAQDIQQLYRVSFREALAGISTVAYPPPVATGRIDIHDVWR